MSSIWLNPVDQLNDSNMNKKMTFVTDNEIKPACVNFMMSTTDCPRLSSTASVSHRYMRHMHVSFGFEYFNETNWRSRPTWIVRSTIYTIISVPRTPYGIRSLFLLVLGLNWKFFIERLYRKVFFHAKKLGVDTPREITVSIRMWFRIISTMRNSQRVVQKIGIRI